MAVARCVALLCALVLLQVLAEEENRCAYDAAGDLVGQEVTFGEVHLTPKNKKQYQYHLTPIQGCHLNGVSAKVCDLFAPEVNVEVNLTVVNVYRLGPRIHPLTLDVKLFCDPLTRRNINL